LPNNEVEYIAIGRILKPQGTRGEVKILPLTDFPERFATMEKILLDLDGRFETRSVEKVSSLGRFIVMKLSGIDDMNAALLLKNALLKVTRQELVPLPDGEYYVFDLVGLNVHTTAGRHLGQIKDVLQTGANDVYIVEGVTPRQLLIPALKQVVLSIDLETGKMVVELPEGLED